MEIVGHPWPFPFIYSWTWAGLKIIQMQSDKSGLTFINQVMPINSSYMLHLWKRHVQYKEVYNNQSCCKPAWKRTHLFCPPSSEEVRKTVKETKPIIVDYRTWQHSVPSFSFIQPQTKALRFYWMLLEPWLELGSMVRKKDFWQQILKMGLV